MITSLRSTTPPQGRSGSQQALLRAALIVLAASALPTVSAARDCWVDSSGRRHCRLSVGTRIAIAVAVAVACLLAILAIFFSRRRRMRRANMAFVAAQQHQQANHPYGNQYQYGNAPYDPAYAAQFQQYPPQQGQGYYGAQAPQGGYNYTPPQGPPPPNYQEYNAPRSPPPTAKA